MRNTTTHIKFLSFFCCIYSIIGITHAQIVDYKTYISISWDVSEYNSSYNIEKAKLLEQYIDSLLEEIFEFKREHAINSKEIDAYIFDLKMMSSALGNIQTLSIEKKDAETITDSIIEELSASKIEIWIVLKEELEKSKEAFSIYKREKTVKAGIISIRMITFLDSFSPKVEALSNTQKKTDILISLSRIRSASNSLWSFWNKLFSSQLKMNESYNNYIREIRRELETIRAIIVSK